MITNLTKNILATHFDSHVTSVRLNGSITINDFVTQEVDQDTVTIEFNVPNDVRQITRLEINGSNGLLSDSNLFVPVEVDTRFKYVLRVG